MLPYAAVYHIIIVVTMNPFNNNNVHRRQFGRRLWLCLLLFLLAKMAVCYTTIRSHNNKDGLTSSSSPLKPTTISVPNKFIYKSHRDSLQRHQTLCLARSDDMADKDTSSKIATKQKTIIKGTNAKTKAKAKRTKSTSSNAVVKGTTTATTAKKKKTSTKAKSKAKSSIAKSKTTVKGAAKKSDTSNAKTKKKTSKSTTKGGKTKKAPPSRKKKKRIVKHTPHTRELEILDHDPNNNTQRYTNIIGIDEAGRGPLAGPVVVAAVICPNHLPGIVDGKTVSTEKRREALYEELVSLKNVRYAVCIIDAARIDEINNISEATLEGMRLATTALMVMDCRYKDDPSLDILYNTKEIEEPSIDIEEGCYVVVHAPPKRIRRPKPYKYDAKIWDSYYALIDGFMIPKDMPCNSEAIIKGDAKEFCIAAASIIAKVTRDRLMHQYHKLYPKYNFQQHKAYPTKAHFEAIKKYGPCPIHRRTFAPLKDLEEFTTAEIIILDDDHD